MKKDFDYYMSLPYTVSFQKDVEDDYYFIWVPELVGCTSCGDTLEEALWMIEDAKACWIEATLEDGRHIPEPKPTHGLTNPFIGGLDFDSLDPEAQDTLRRIKQNPDGSYTVVPREEDKPAVREDLPAVRKIREKALVPA
ncbi:MAG: type II toxin-antitoxin system HicB family antitoxin [Clostridiales bacterium]|jgi:predicted RNase H-like HicB family nuclease|nr:type II toxin-antitoxin system HicB family antitoxin [Clostridiales bacterium]